MREGLASFILISPEGCAIRPPSFPIRISLSTDNRFWTPMYAQGRIHASTDSDENIKVPSLPGSRLVGSI